MAASVIVLELTKGADGVWGLEGRSSGPRFNNNSRPFFVGGFVDAEGFRRQQQEAVRRAWCNIQNPKKD